MSFFTYILNFMKNFIIFIGLTLMFSGLINYMLLAFAYRDFSWGLSAMFIFTPLVITLGYYLLQRQLKAIIN